jgi:Na+-translocating ferredoxin:NAD+ oxidoreductase RnfC subunit
MKNPYHRQAEVSTYREYRRVPIPRLVSRLGLAKYDVPAPLTDVPATYSRVTILLQQHIGAPALPIVQVGDRVKAGDMLGDVPQGALGAPVHASIDGVVCEVTNEAIVIEAN